MVICPSCQHNNPDGATQCEACYTPLPAQSTCPNCGVMVQVDATFCGQCGFNLQNSAAPETGGPQTIPPTMVSPGVAATPPSPQGATIASSIPDPVPVVVPDPLPIPPPAVSAIAATTLQVRSFSLLHVQTNTTIEIPSHLPLVHIGKPNDQIPPDIDVSGFPDSEIVSRIHADLRIEGDVIYLEDVGSSNGTYLNHNPLPPGNRHRLRSGDRIALGKGDKMTFLFQSQGS